MHERRSTATPAQGDDAEDDEGMSGGSEHGDESEDEEDEDDTSSPWRGMSAELAALSTPGSVGMRGRSRGPPPAPRDGSDAGGTSSHDGEGGDEVRLAACLRVICRCCHPGLRVEGWSPRQACAVLQGCCNTLTSGIFRQSLLHERSVERGLCSLEGMLVALQPFGMWCTQFCSHRV